MTCLHHLWLIGGFFLPWQDIAKSSRSEWGGCECSIMQDNEMTVMKWFSFNYCNKWKRRLVSGWRGFAAAGLSGFEGFASEAESMKWRSGFTAQRSNWKMSTGEQRLAPVRCPLCGCFVVLLMVNKANHLFAAGVFGYIFLAARLDIRSTMSGSLNQVWVGFFLFLNCSLTVMIHNLFQTQSQILSPPAPWLPPSASTSTELRAGISQSFHVLCKNTVSVNIAKWFVGKTVKALDFAWIIQTASAGDCPQNLNFIGFEGEFRRVYEDHAC